MVELTLGTIAGTLRASHRMPRCAVAAGGTVLTLSGALPVEFVSPGDRLITRSGARRVQSVGISIVRNADVVRISEGVLAKDRPEAEVVLSPEQPILLRDWRARAMAGAAQTAIAAGRLIDGEYIRSETLDEVWMLSIRFDQPEVIYVNGLELLCDPDEG